MKIDNFKNGKTYFYLLKTGEVFEYENELFMVISSFSIITNSFYNAVDLSTGILTNFKRTDLVIKHSNAEITL